GIHAQDLPGRTRIMIHLRLQCIQIVEFLLVAQLGHELHRHAPAVEIALEIEQVHFQQRLADLVHRGPHAQAGHARPAAFAFAQSHAYREDALHRTDPLAQVDVRGGKAQCAAELVAVFHLALDHGRPSSAAAPANSPDASNWRTRLAETRAPSSRMAGITQPAKPAFSPSSRNKATSPPRLWPKRKSAPTHTSLTARRSTNTRCTKSW